MGNESDDDEVVSTVTRYVDEFDFGTRISQMSNGSIRLKFPAMPPMWKCRRGAFDDLVTLLRNKLGVVVVGLDKELFLLPKPGEITVDLVAEALIALRRANEEP